MIMVFLLLSFQGIVGNLSSGKSALVHRYLTGTYVQEESPEGKSLLDMTSKILSCFGLYLFKIKAIVNLKAPLCVFFIAVM